jgi:hypothetical protein
MRSGVQILPFPERHVEGERWEPWVTETSIAAHFAVTDRTIRRWRLEGGMPSKLIGGSRRYRIGEAERWQSTRGESA